MKTAAHVLWPSLTRAVYLAQLTHGGYSSGVLAPRFAGFKALLRRRVVEEDYGIGWGPCFVNVIPPPRELVAKIEADAEVALDEAVAQSVASRVRDYYRTFETYPPGFSPESVGGRDHDAVLWDARVRDDTAGEDAEVDPDIYLWWHGPRSLRETFGDRVGLPDLDARREGSAPSQATGDFPLDESVYAIFGGDFSTNGAQVQIVPAQHAVLHTTPPLFYARLIADMAELARELSEARRAFKAAQDAVRPVEIAAREAEVAAREAQRRRDLHAFFHAQD